MIALMLAAALLQDGLAKEFDALLPKLAAESLEERTNALERLKTLARADPSAARPLLRERLAAAADEQVKSGLRAALDSLPKLELKASVDGPVEAGRVPAVKIRLRNLSDGEVCVVRSLDASDCGWRYPKYTARILDPDGKDVTPKMGGRCGNMNAITEGDVSKLAPGVEFDPLGEGSFGIWALHQWKPDRPGVWKVGLIVDYSAADPDEWNGRLGAELLGGPAGNGVRALLARVPKEKLTAEIEVKVEPAK